MDDQDIFTQSFGLLGCHASQHKGLDTVVSWDLINMRRHALRAPAKSPVHQLVSSTQHQCEHVQQISFLHKRKKKRKKRETWTSTHIFCWESLLPVCSQSWGDVPSWNLSNYVSPEERAMNHPHSFWIPVKFCFLKDRNGTYLLLICYVFLDFKIHVFL